MVSKLPQRLHPKGYKPGFLQQRNSRSQEDIVRPLEQVSSRPSSAGISLTPLQGHNNAPADYMEQNAVSKSQASLAPLSSNLNPSVDIPKSAPMSFPRHLATAPLMRPRLYVLPMFFVFLNLFLTCRHFHVVTRISAKKKRPESQIA